MLRAWLGIAVVAMAARGLYVGSVVDVGLANGGWAAAVIALGLGLGAFARRAPSVFDALALAIALFARGVLASGSLTVFGTGSAGLAIALAASLFPPAVLLGRFAAPLLAGRSASIVVGWLTSEALVLLGWTPSWPAAVTAPAIAALAFIVTRGLPDASPSVAAEDDAETDQAPAAPPQAAGVAAALPLGVAITLALVAMQRVMPGYASPTVHADAEWVVALLVPAALVAALVAVLIGDPSSTGGRVVRFVGATGLAVALLFVVYDASIRYQINGHIALTRQLRAEAHALSRDVAHWIEPWDLWVTSFVGYLSLGLGVVLGGMRGRAYAALAVGAALAFAAEPAVLLREPVFGPAWLLIASAGFAVYAGVVGLVGPWGLLAAPVVAVSFWLRDDIHWVGYDEMRRPGELSAEAHTRSLALETQLFSSPRSGTTAAEGTLAYLQTSLGREPMFPVYETAFDAFDAKVKQMEDDSREGLERFFGVRYAGVTAHAGQPPVGADGSIGRMLRLFGVAGDALVIGLGAELVALDWATTDAAGDVLVATPSADRDASRFGDYLLVLDDVAQTEGLQAAVRPNVAFALADVADEGRSFDLVVVAPERAEWPGSGASSTRERLASVAATLAPGGRCLAWIDTTGLDARALRARVAAFGAVFGERGAVFVEPRGQEPPFLLGVGWIDEAGDPTDVLAADASRGIELSGLRSTIRSRGELARHLLVDGAGLARLAADGPVHARGAFVTPGRFAPTGWAAVADIYDPAAQWADLPVRAAGAPDAMPTLIESLVRHDAYSLHLEFVNQTIVENLGDVDWDAYDHEVEALVEAARLEPDNPLVHYVAASLGERLVVNGEFTRFGQLYEGLDAESLESWRLELLKAAALDGMTEPELAADAMDRARELAGLEPLR